MYEKQFFEELKKSLGQAIDYANGKPSKARTRTPWHQLTEWCRLTPVGNLEDFFWNPNPAESSVN